jgi:hypothetical protein
MAHVENQGTVMGSQQEQEICILSESVQTGCGAHSVHYSLSSGLFPGIVKLTTHRHLLQRLRMYTAIPQLSPCVCKNIEELLCISQDSD